MVSSGRNYYNVYGIYRCDIDTNASVHGDGNDAAPSPRGSVYVGIYSSGG